MRALSTIWLERKRIGARSKQLCQSFAEDGVNPVGFDIAGGNENEVSKMHSGVWHGEFWRVDNCVVV